MSALRETFVNELRDVYDAEKQLLKALPKFAKAAEDEQLQVAFEAHLEETEEHVRRVEEVFQMLGEPVKAKKCKAMQGLIAEGEDRIAEEGGHAALISAAQKVEHYEIASYGSLKAWARLLGEEEAAGLLEETLDEEIAADEKLTGIAESTVNAEESEEEGEEEAAGQKRSKKRN